MKNPRTKNHDHRTSFEKRASIRNDEEEVNRVGDRHREVPNGMPVEIAPHVPLQRHLPRALEDEEAANQAYGKERGRDGRQVPPKVRLPRSLPTPCYFLPAKRQRSAATKKSMKFR